MFLKERKIYNKIRRGGVGGRPEQGRGRKGVTGLIAVTYLFIPKLLLPLLDERRNRKNNSVCSLLAKLVVYVNLISSRKHCQSPKADLPPPYCSAAFDGE